MSKPTKSKSKKSNSRKAHRHLGKPAKGRKPARTNSRKRGPLPADPQLAGIAPSEIKPTQVRAPITDCATWDAAAVATSTKLGLAKPMGRAVWLRWMANIMVCVDPQVLIDLIPPAPVVVVEPEPAGNVTPTSTPVDAQIVEEPAPAVVEPTVTSVEPTLADVLNGTVATQEVKSADAPLQTTTDETKLAPRDPEADADEPRVEYTP